LDRVGELSYKNSLIQHLKPLKLLFFLLGRRLIEVLAYPYIEGWPLIIGFMV
jgi:hypothetical protein